MAGYKMGGGDVGMVYENHYETHDREEDNNKNGYPKNPATNLRKRIYVLPSGRKLKVITSDENGEQPDN
jgi:hypothetical protein